VSEAGPEPKVILETKLAATRSDRHPNGSITMELLALNAGRVNARQLLFAYC
jgi:hypothetical protein